MTPSVRYLSNEKEFEEMVTELINTNTPHAHLYHTNDATLYSQVIRELKNEPPTLILHGASSHDKNEVEYIKYLAEKGQFALVIVDYAA